MALTLDEANRIAAGAIAHAASIDILVCVAVCDAGGRLVSFQRMDGAIWAAVALLQPEILTPDIARRATPSGRERASSCWPDVPHRASVRVDARRAARLSPGGSRKHTRPR